MPKKSELINYVRDLVTNAFEKEGYTAALEPQEFLDVYYDFTKHVREDFIFCIALQFGKQDFSLVYGVHPLIWNDEVDSDPIGNFACYFRNSQWQFARYFAPHLFESNEYREGTLSWKLAKSPKQLDGAVADLLVAHQEIAPQFFSQFDFPEPMSSITVQDFEEHSLRLRKLGMKAAPQPAMLIAKYYDSVGQSSEVISLCQWALDFTKDLNAEYPRTLEDPFFVTMTTQLRSLLVKHGGSELG